MQRQLKGFKRSAIELDFDLYRTGVPIPGLARGRLSVIDIWPEAVTRTLLFVHGYAGAAETWEHQLNYFSATHRVVAPDLRGHGQSDAPYTRYTMPELVADLEAIRQGLELGDNFALIGHSFGGAICVEYARAHPEHVERLALIATAGEYPLPRVVSLLYRLPTAVFQPWWKYRPRWNAAIHVMKRMMLNNVAQWKGWEAMAALRMPALVITGERDNYFPRRVYDDVGVTIPGAEVVNIGASKHKVQLERAQAVNRTLERFIDEGKQRSTWRSHVSEAALTERRPWLDAYAKGTPRTVPIPRRPLTDFLESAAEQVPRRSATVFFDQHTSYRRLNRQANQFGQALYGLGLRPGERVLIVLPNVPQFVVAYYGTMRTGGVVVLSNPDAGIDQVVREARLAEARIVVTLREFDRLAGALRREAGVGEVIWVDAAEQIPAALQAKLGRQWPIAGADLAEAATGPAAGHALADLLADAPPEKPAVKVTAGDVAVISFTSGTTDEPKGVALTHSNLVANAIQTRHWLPDARYGREVFLAAVPLIHAYGMTTAMNLPIALGATIVLVPAFDVPHILETIRTYRPTIFPGVPSMYAAISHAPGARNYGLASIRACISGAAPLPVEVQEAFEKLTQGTLVEGYGLTEAAPVTHGNPLDAGRKPGSIGVPIPNTDAKIVDLATGEDLPPGQVGELWVKGPQVMLGYWQREAATAEVLRDGWLDTGDVAVMDSDGYFHIIGRTRDVIRAGEHTVYPRDVEELLYENNKVHEVAVVGVPRTAVDQKVKAFVVPRPGAALSKDELLDLCRRRLEAYAVPWEIEFREELPRSFTGKVIRRLLVE
jgi:long-chain acyl-CoA synthetase